ALLTGLLVAGYYVVVHTVGGFLSRELGLSEFAWMPAAVLVLAIVFAPMRTRLQQIVDRLFYRAEYIYKQGVIDFGRRASRATAPEEVLEHFLERCESLLHPSFAAVYVRGGDKMLPLVRSSAEVPAIPREFNPDSFLGRYFTRYRTPLMVEFL